jgi:hypothetical protein
MLNNPQTSPANPKRVDYERTSTPALGVVYELVGAAC